MTHEFVSLGTGQDFIERCRRRKAELGPRRNQDSVPMLPIDLPSLPAGWCWSGFSELCERVSVGHVGPTSEYFCIKGEGIPLVRSQDVRPGKLHLDSVAYVTAEFHESLKKSKLTPGDILIVRVGANRGDCCVVPEGVGDLNCANIVFARPLYPNGFFGFYFRSEFGQKLLLSATTGSAQGVINTGSVAQMPVPVPPSRVQERISSILSAYDDLIENNTRRIQILEEMAQMLYREWFVTFRFPGHENVRMVGSEIGPIPDSWTVEPLEAVCKRVTDGSHFSPVTVESPHLMASSKDMHKWGLDLATCRTISKEDFDTLVRNDCRPLAGDILITKDGANYLKFCFAVEKDLDVVLLSSIAMLRPSTDRACSQFLAFYLADGPVKTRLAGRVSGAAIPRIVLKDFREFKILVPPMAIQRNFSRIVEPFIALCWRLIDKNANLRTTRDLLLPKLISGEIPVEAAEEAMEQTA